MIPFSDEELMPVVEKSIEKVQPMLALDGGGVTLLGIKNGVVYVQLSGACHGCPSSNDTLQNGIEKRLKSEIHPEMTVVNIPLGEEARWKEEVERN